MHNGSDLCISEFIIPALPLWFAFPILCRESFDSPHPQGSWSHDWMVLWFCIAMIPWFGDHSSFPAPIAIDLSTMSFEHSPCHTCNSLKFLARHVTWFGLWYLLKMFHFFPQIVISCYRRFTSLPFFRHSPRGKKQPISPDQQEYQIVHGLQTVLDPYMPHFHGLWTLWGLWLFQQYGIWIRYFVNQEGGGCMVAPPLLLRIFTPKNVFFCSTDSHWILERVIIFQGWPIPGKLTIVNHHGWSSLLHLFRP